MTAGRRLTQAEAYELLQRLLGYPNAVSFAEHLGRRGRQRSFDIFDVRRVLIHGTLLPNIEWDEKYQNWVYHVVGRDYDGDQLTVVLTMDEVSGVIRVITAHD